ncbi:MAG: hypothetical protein HYY40_10135, partial [Bacteroidetes bacterium]|nr:hypothetical protein [Bacteroidota bacterium]
MIINSNSGLSDIFMGKCSNTGSFLWVKGYGSVDNERPSGMTLDFTGNIYLTGVFNSVSLSFGSTSLGNAGSYDIFICKFDSGGNTVWAKSIGNSQDDFSFEIACDASGNAIITGEFSSPTLLINPFTLINNGISDIFCVKYSGQGIVDWAKNFGNEEVEGGYDVAVNPAGRINITGAYQSSFITFDTKTMMNSGGFDVFTACLNPSGTTRWAATAGGSDDNDGGNSIAVDAADNAVITGFFKSPVISFGSNILYNEGSSDIFIAKYSPTGKILWANSAAGIYEDNATGIAADGEGNTVITGYFFSNKIYMGGFDLTLTGNGYPDIFIAKYDSLGNVTWVSQGKGSNYDKSNCIAVSASGSIYIAGMFWSPTLTFDAISVNRTGTGYND